MKLSAVGVGVRSMTPDRTGDVQKARSYICELTESKRDASDPSALPPGADRELNVASTASATLSSDGVRTAASTASVKSSFSVVSGKIRGDKVSTSVKAQRDYAGKVTQTATVSLTNVYIFGVKMPDRPAPNTVVSYPDFTAILNYQTDVKDASGAKVGVTVEAIHIDTRYKAYMGLGIASASINPAACGI
ncbi:hypothetical protein ADK75_07410 [Streptomyces virginiae]|uniref:Uncharacterized protein n=2 Tax=Streptomyces TaxID=1883 RepID=A0A0L8N1G5_STRVG|nr:hypothetical protein ADK75_07410 [Streptomyces virginiae]